MLPIFIALVICFKIMLRQVFLRQAQLVGEALSLVSERVANRDANQLRPIIIKAGVPEWYIWCFDRPNSEHVEEHGLLILSNSRSFGTCTPPAARNTDSYPYDLSELKII